MIRNANPSPYTKQISDKSLHRMLADYPDSVSVWHELDRLDTEQIYNGQFNGTLALAIWYHIVHKWEPNKPLPISIVSVLVSSKVRRLVRTGWVSVWGKYGERMEYLHSESADRSELVSAVVADRLGIRSPRRNGTERDPTPYLTPTTIYKGIRSAIVRCDRELWNKGTPYWTTNFFVRSKDGTRWVKVSREVYRKVVAEHKANRLANVWDSYDQWYAAQTTPEPLPYLESKIIVRHLTDTFDERFPNLSAEEYDMVRDSFDTNKAREVWDLLARGFTWARVCNSYGCNRKYIQSVREQANKILTRDTVSDTQAYTLAANTKRLPNENARFRTVDTQRTFGTESSPNKLPTISERFTAIKNHRTQTKLATFRCNKKAKKIT